MLCCIFLGEYKTQRDGRGIYYYKDGSRYEGEYAGGRKHGKGMYIFANGDKLLGTWVDNEYTGVGIMSYDNGDHYEGLRNFMNTRTCSHYCASHCYCYPGQFNQSYIPHGHGVYQHSNGDLYSGSFKEGARDGKGKLTKTSGGKRAHLRLKISCASIKLLFCSLKTDIFEGEFQVNEMHGVGVYKYGDGDKYEVC